MKRTLILSAAALAVLLVGATSRAQESPEPQKSSPTPSATVGPNFVDADGDGVCDRWSERGRGQGQARGGRGKGYGPRDGSGNKGVGPRDGSGHGPGSASCDGKGPKGRGRRGGRR